ncbi:MAG: ribonucleoside-triphosphate reductase, adenosylcobalamin-dependent [Pyrinomonadaceae bacterium]
MPRSARSILVARRSYCRPHGDGTYETWAQVTDRVCRHQEWLWERALGRRLSPDERTELKYLGDYQKAMLGSVAGRTNWLGGTQIAREREASMFNCAFSRAETVYDIVDLAWLLLQGCGTGFEAVSGSLNGFPNHIPEIVSYRSERTSKGGFEKNNESYDATTKTWTIMVGDSAVAWAKAVGKIIASKFYGVQKLVLDFTQIRPAGERLRGYGWISSGDEMIAKAFLQMAAIMNDRAGKLLRVIDIHDIVNLVGIILSSRRSAQLSQQPYGTGDWMSFARCKSNYTENAPWRGQSNNNLYFLQRPTLDELRRLMEMVVDSGGSDPGLFNMEEARRRAPWCAGVNPCAEILLCNKGFCNLVETNLGGFADFDIRGLADCIKLFARANYRQTLVNLQDGVLQRAWHENNQYLRLCGVSVTGITCRDDLTEADWMFLRNEARFAAMAMAHEIGTQPPQAVTTVKPSGTLSKVMDTTSGMHRPVGKYIFNDVMYSKHDEVVDVLRDAGYLVYDHPTDTTSALVRFTESWEGSDFTKTDGGLEIDDEPAVEQLNRYLKLMRTWCDHNVSCTIYYHPEEVGDLTEKLHENWDDYVGVSFLPRYDCTGKGSQHAWMPQRVVTEKEFRDYSAGLKPVSEEALVGGLSMEEEKCATGACPIN